MKTIESNRSRHTKVGVALLSLVLAVAACGGSDDATVLEVVARDGTVIEFAVAPTERAAVNQPDETLVVITENNVSNDMLSTRIGAAIDGCAIAGYPQWSEVEPLIESGAWPNDGSDIPAGGSAGTTFNAELAGSCERFELTLIARSEDGTISKLVLPIVTTAAD